MANSTGLVPTNNNDGGQELEALKGNLEDTSKSMVVFSVTLNCLFSEQKVTSTAGTKDFIEVRNNTRRNAAVYQRTVLPKAESIVQKISTFMDYYQHLEYEDWKDCLDEQIQEAEQGASDCEIMIQMHAAIIKVLNKDVGKANGSQATLRLEAERLLEAQRIQKTGAAVGTVVAVIGAVVAGVATGGLAFAAGTAAFYGTGIGAVGLVEAIKSQANGKIAENNIDLVSRLIESLRLFIHGLNGLSSFFTVTSSKLKKLRDHAEKGEKTHAEKMKEKHFKIMKNSSKEIEQGCERFLAVAQFIKTQMDSIPKDPSDDNYVDRWLKEQLEEFEKENSYWGGFQRLQWGKKNKSRN